VLFWFRLVSGSFDKTVRIWSSDGTLIHHLMGFVSSVSAICYVSRCRVLWTAGGTPDAYLFEPKTGENVCAAIAFLVVCLTRMTLVQGFLC